MLDQGKLSVFDLQLVAETTAFMKDSARCTIEPLARSGRMLPKQGSDLLAQYLIEAIGRKTYGQRYGKLFARLFARTG